MAITKWTRDASGKAGIRLLVAGAVALLLLPLVSGPASAAEYGPAGPIVIPGEGPPAGCPTLPPPNNSCPATKGQPYPSVLTIAGATGTISDLNIKLNGVTHASPSDFDIMLEGPDGTNILFMSDDCGAAHDQNPISGANFIFDDAAATSIPADSACASGTYRPLDDEDPDTEFQFTAQDAFPAPAPAPSANTTLAVFNGKDPNGDWKLWVTDDNPDTPGVEGGRIESWSLDLSGVTGGNPVLTTTTSSSTTSSSSMASSSTTTTTTATSATTSTTVRTAAQATTTTTIGAAATATTAPAGGGTTATTAAGPILRLSSSQVAPGERVTVAGDRLAANTAYQLTFNSAPVSLGTVNSNASGSFQTVVTIPSDAAEGSHQITASDPSGRVVATVDLTVSRSGTAAATSSRLARTGTDVQTLTMLAAASILLGIYIVSTGPKPKRVRADRRRW